MFSWYVKSRLGVLRYAFCFQRMMDPFYIEDMVERFSRRAKRTKYHYLTDSTDEEMLRPRDVNAGFKRRRNMISIEPKVYSVYDLFGKDPPTSPKLDEEEQRRRSRQDYMRRVRQRKLYNEAEQQFEMYSEAFDRRDIYGVGAFCWVMAGANWTVQRNMSSKQ